MYGDPTHYRVHTVQRLGKLTSSETPAARILKERAKRKHTFRGSRFSGPQTWHLPPTPGKSIRQRANDALRSSFERMLLTKNAEPRLVSFVNDSEKKLLAAHLHKLHELRDNVKSIKTPQSCCMDFQADYRRRIVECLSNIEKKMTVDYMTMIWRTNKAKMLPQDVLHNFQQVSLAYGQVISELASSVYKATFLVERDGKALQECFHQVNTIQSKVSRIDPLGECCGENRYR